MSQLKEPTFGPRNLPRSVLVGLEGEIMDVRGCLIRANFDPGLFLERDHAANEPLHRWQARAGVMALAIAGHLRQGDDQ